MDEIEKLKKQVADLTAKVKELKGREKEILESEKHYRLISKLVSDVVLELSFEPDGGMEIVGPILGSVRDISGYSHEEIRSSADWHKVIHPEDRAVFDQVNDDLRAGKGRELDLRALRKDGGVMWIRARSIPDQLDETGRPRSGFVQIKDISDQKRAEEELLRLERLRALGQMAAGISHNLNNILTTVIGPARLLEQELTDPALRQETEYIIRSARRARDLVRRLNEAVRGGVDSDIRNISVNKIVQEAIELTRSIWKDETESKGIEIRVETELEEVPDIRGTRSGMLDIIVNLLLNSVDAMPDGGKIIVRTEPAAEGLKLTVSDNGIGMNEQTLKRVFEPFFTTKAEIGTGLGLSTVFGAITRWGGTVDVRSSPGEGAKFVFTMPASKEEDTGAVAPGPRGESRRAKILVVEDVEAIRLLLSRVLSTKHDLTLVADGEEAIRSFASEDYDVAVIDLGLTGIPGDRIGRLLRQSDRSLATVLISGWELADDDPRVKQFDFRLRKPFDDLDELQSVVAEAVKLHDSRVEGPGPT